MLKIRMARGGRTHRPVYSLVVTDSRNPRDGRFIEKLGQYDPSLKEETLKAIKVDKIKAWVSKGAILSDTVRTLLKKNNIAL